MNASSVVFDKGPDASVDVESCSGLSRESCKWMVLTEPRLEFSEYA